MSRRQDPPHRPQAYAGEVYEVARRVRMCLELIRALGRANPALQGRDMLNAKIEDLVWSVVGGEPTERAADGGCLDQTGVPRPHLWVVGRMAHQPGVPVLLADITANQFGHPPVLAAPLPVPGYRANTSAKVIAGYREREERFVQMAVDLVEASQHLTLPEAEDAGAHERR